MNLRTYIISHCVSPLKVKIYDAYSQSYVVRELPCGKCLHCRVSHVNEWCTRLFAQRKYSKYCYYVSLDYAPFDETSPVAMQLAKETAACKHSINKNHTFGLHPLVLCKNHLQDFFKRLRKNTQVKFQYFACGEYGTHANGRGYGRPHFHILLFSNVEILCSEFNRAWTIDGYKIGRVDFKDMNAIIQLPNENLKIFKYVCKYLQKQDFDFEKLATIDFHRAYFKSLEQTLVKTDTLFPEHVPITDAKQIEFDWHEYTSAYSPFIVCSRRPSIGKAYALENLERFAHQDFRLFGLQAKGLAFPRYYLRLAKERNFPYMALGRKSEMPSSSARMGNILQVLSFLYTSSLSLDTWSQSTCHPWRVCVRYSRDTEKNERCIVYKHYGFIPCRSLSFYDKENKFIYQFTGYEYKVWSNYRGVYSYLHDMSIIDVLNEFAPLWEKYHREWITPLYNQRILREKELSDTISALFEPTEDNSSLQLFQEEVYRLYLDEISSNYKTKLLMQNSKQTL